MQLFATIFLSLSPFILKAQNNQDNLWGSKKFKFGFSLQIAPSYWKQKNFNSELEQHSLPKARDISSSFTVGDIIQWNKFRFTALLLAMINSNSVNGNHLKQQFGGIEINGEYFLLKKKQLALSPLLGAGLLNGTSRIRNSSISGSFPDVLANANTTELFNRQGYINVALNLGFDYSPRYKDHLYQIAIGYRLGFANTRWSTDPKKEVLSDAPTDAIRQFYLALRMNFLFSGRR